MKRRREDRRGAFDLIEEAVHVLRSTPLQVLGWYAMGVLPFLLALLYFWTDMSWSALAFEHRAEASFGVALSFIWMKTAQAIFARKLRARLSGNDAPVTASELFSIALYQAIIQPSRLFVLPLAALATIPFAWVFAFYENVTVLGRGETARKLMSQAWRQASLWPRQNHCLQATYLLLVIIVFVNVGILVLLLPTLVKMLAGVDTIFTRTTGGMFNTTFFAVSATLTYLICNPLLKAIYALRCFYGASLRSGEDLAAEVRRLPPLGAVTAVLAALLFVVPATSAAPAAEPLEARAVELNRAIDETVKRPEFSWKLPRQKDEVKAERKWPFFDAIGRFLKATGRAIKRAFNAIGEWIEKLFRQPPSPSRPLDGSGWVGSSRGWMLALLVTLGLLAIGLVVQTLRQIRLRRGTPATASSSPAKPDLKDESVTADLLPEDEWLALAREHLGRGELRFALRAFFFAAMAHLAAREVLTLGRHKSNRDYHAELRRRAGDQPPLVEAFGHNIAMLERVWYGQHEIDEQGVRAFEENVNRIRAW